MITSSGVLSVGRCSVGATIYKVDVYSELRNTYGAPFMQRNDVDAYVGGLCSAIERLSLFPHVVEAL